MTTRELLRRRREEQVTVCPHTRLPHLTLTSSIFNQFNSIRAGVSRREVIGGIFATETRGGVGGEDPTG